MEKSSATKILMIEDDKQVIKSLKLALEARNFNLTTISDGNEALDHLEKIEREQYDLILLDLMLPGATGWEILVRIRSMPHTSDIPVIMLTAVDDESSETRALYDGADDYITKPFTLKVLIARIEANLRKKSSGSFKDFDIHFSDGKFEELSSREKEILNYVSKGYSNKEIAQLTYISETTVRNHISNVFQKLKVTSRIQAAIVALKYDLL